jgi:transposase-like protein
MYGIDFIRRAVACKEEGHAFPELKEAFNIPPETYYQWKEKLKNGYNGIIPFRERRRKIDKEKLIKAVEENPDAYLYELARQFDCTPQAVFLMLERLNITRKKNPLPAMKNQKRNGQNIQHG